MAMTYKEAREEERVKKVNALFRRRHTTPDHFRWYERPPAGKWLRVECANCDVVINYLEEDL
jgi:hypothetical protein